MRALFAAACAFLVGSGLMAEPRTLGYQLDISRSKVPKMATLYRIVDLLATCGYSQFQLYTEHTFAYRGHESVWAEASPMTPDEVRALDDYCAKRGIELVPNQNSLGHMENWLMQPGYNDLAEMPNAGLKLPWGDAITTEARALCPTDPRSLALVAGLYDQLFPCFRSRKVNVGCDEAFEVVFERKDGYRVYFDYLKKIQKLCEERHHTMMFWSDIALHRPEYLRELPKDVIALVWGYEADHPFECETAQLEAAHMTFYVCPGTSAWGSLCGRVRNMMGNVDNAITAGERHGMDGVLLADWGDGGTPQPFLVAVPGIVYTAHRFRGERLTEDGLAKAIDRLLGGNVGETLVGYGNLYLKIGALHENTSEIYRINWAGLDYVRPEGMTDATIKATFDAWRELKAKRDLSGSPDWVRGEFEVVDLLLACCEDRTKGVQKTLKAKYGPKYRELWLRYNRRGGMEKSVNHLFGDHKYF